MGLTPERKAAEETLGELKRLKKGSRISIKNTELLSDKQSKETRNNGDKRRAQHTVPGAFNELTVAQNPQKREKRDRNRDLYLENDVVILQ